MRIRKRTPARAASPALSPSPPPLMQQLKEVPREEEEEDDAEEKRVILVDGAGRQEDVVRALSAADNKNSSPDAVPDLGDGAAARCSRNDGKRWRCKSAAVPGSPFCDRHVSWSTRQRQPRPRKQSKKNKSSVAVEPLMEEEEAEDKDRVDGSAGAPLLVRDEDYDDGGFYYYYGGFQPGGRKRPRGGGPGPAA